MPEELVISADSHAQWPPGLFERRLPAKLRDAAPHYEPTDDGDVVVAEGRVVEKIGLDVMGERRPEDIRFKGGRVAEARPGFYDGAARLADLDADGVHGEVIYGFPPVMVSDDELRLACVRAFNDWLVEEFCAAAPDRLYGAIFLPFWDLDLALAELRRASDLGLKVVIGPPALPDRPYTSLDWDPLYAELQERDLPIVFHVGVAKGLYRYEGRAKAGLNFTSVFRDGEEITSQLIWSGVPERFPALRIVVAEGGIGWVAWLLQVMDEVWEKHRYWMEPKLDLPPSQYFQRQFGATFQADPPGILTRHLAGIDNLMWGSDYPHPESTFPLSEKAIEDQMGELPANERQRIIGLNAARVFGFQLRPTAG